MGRVVILSAQSMDGTDRRSATDRKRRIVKITFVSPFASLAGGTRVMAIYARILTERGHHVTVVSQPHNDPPTLRSELVRLLRNREKPLPRAPTPLLDFLGDVVCGGFGLPIARDMAHYQQLYRDHILTLPHIADIEALMQVAAVSAREGLPI